jgi:hypothetical protein
VWSACPTWKRRQSVLRAGDEAEVSGLKYLNQASIRPVLRRFRTIAQKGAPSDLTAVLQNKLAQ